MNILYLKYAIEVERAHSINKAAENLYMGQPNLSRAIKELEESIGLTIFERTPRGMVTTDQGREFLQSAKELVHQVDAFEGRYCRSDDNMMKFSVSVARAGYLSEAFIKFAGTIDPAQRSELIFCEANAMRAIRNILESGYRLAIIRYAVGYDRYFQDMFDEKGLTDELIAEFSSCLLMSKDSPLADKEEITLEDLEGNTEIAYADPFAPTISPATVKKGELGGNVLHRILVFDRGSQLDLLSGVTGSFMWASPMSDEMLRKRGLVQRHCKDVERVYRDVLVHKRDYHRSELDERFLEDVHRAKREYLDRRIL